MSIYYIGYDLNIPPKTFAKKVRHLSCQDYNALQPADQQWVLFFILKIRIVLN